MSSNRPIFATIALLACSLMPSAYSAVNFEFYNKDQDASGVIVSVEAKGGSINPAITKKKIEKDKTLQATYAEGTNLLMITTSVKGIEHIFIVAPINAKTVFVTFDSARPVKLYPQTGKLFGYKGVTNSGLPIGNNLAQDQIKQLTTAEVKALTEKKEKDVIDALPENVRGVAKRLKEGKEADAGPLYAALLSDKEFQTLIGRIKVPSNDAELVQELVKQRTSQEVKKRFGVRFAGVWEKLATSGKLDVKAWNDPAADQLDIFAKAYETSLRNKYISATLILKYLPENFDRLVELDQNTKNPDIMPKNINPALFQSFLSKVPLTIKLEDKANLPKVEIVEYADDLVQKSGYPVETIGKAMANLLIRLKLSGSVVKGTLYGWNPSDKFKEELPVEAFTTYLAESGDFNFGQTQLLLNFFKSINYAEVKKSDLDYVKVVGTYFKEKMHQGFSFTDINSALVRNLKFSPKTSQTEVKGLAAALREIQLTKPKIDGEKLFAQMREHPMIVIGAVLQGFLTDFLPKKEKDKAAAIGEGFRRLDAPAKSIPATKTIQGILDDNQVIIVNVAGALTDTDRAAQNLIQSALNTARAKQENKETKSRLTQLNDLVDWLVTQAQLLKANNPESIFTGAPLTENDQSAIRFGIKNIWISGLFDGLAGKIAGWLITKVLEFPPNAQNEVKEATAQIASALVGAAPALIKNFSVFKYLDYLIALGKFKDGKIEQGTLKKETWKVLEVLATDLSKVSGALPRALDAIRDFGAEKK